MWARRRFVSSARLQILIFIVLRRWERGNHKRENWDLCGARPLWIGEISIIAGCKARRNLAESTYKSYEKAAGLTNNTNTCPLKRTISHGGTQTGIAAAAHFGGGWENSSAHHRRASVWGGFSRGHLFPLHCMTKSFLTLCYLTLTSLKLHKPAVFMFLC